MKKIYLLVLAIVFVNSLIAQKKIVLQNPSFEDNKPTNTNYAGYAPPPWMIASVTIVQSGSSCSIAPTPDMNPDESSFGGIKPDDGLFFEGCYADGDSNSACFGGEAVYQQLCKPLQKGVNYSFNIRVAYSPLFGSPAIDSAMFAVYGSNVSPAANQFTNPEVLYRAKVVGTSWQSFTVNFTPQNGTYQYLIIGGYCILSGTQDVYLGFDNITNIDTVCKPIILSTNANICLGNCATVTANVSNGTSPFSYSWNPGGQTTSSISVCPSATTVYTVTIIDAAIDTAISTATVTVNSSTTATISNPATICAGSSYTLTASGGGTYSWSAGGATTSSITVNPSSLTGYTVVVSNGAGCADTVSTHINVSAAPVALFTSSLDTCTRCLQLNNQSTNANIWLWNFGDSSTSTLQNPLHCFADTGIFHIVLMASVSPQCKNIFSLPVPVHGDVLGPFIIPNVFSPNEDGVNDVFRISGVNTCDPFSLKIFDRWGILVYETSKSEESWDGRTSSGIKIVEGTYYYILTANGEKYKGFVTLVR